MTALPFHPRTGLQAIGILPKSGRPVWPVMGGSGPLPEPAAPPADPPADPPAPPDPPDKGFPENTPIVEMTDAERANYFKFHDRRKSDTLRAYQGITPEQALEWKQQAEAAAREQQTPSERALEDARNEARTAARSEADAEWASLMTEAVVEQFVTDPAQRQAVLAGLNATQFMTDGKFDKAKLISHMTGLATAFGGTVANNGQEQPPRQWGQAGQQPPAKSGRDEGLAEAERRGYIKK